MTNKNFTAKAQKRKERKGTHQEIEVDLPFFAALRVLCAFAVKVQKNAHP